MVRSVWSLVRNKENREILSWLGGGALVIIMWTGFIYLDVSKPTAPRTTAPRTTAPTAAIGTMPAPAIIISSNSKNITAPNDDVVAARIRSLGRILEELPIGKIVLHAPMAMKVGDKRKVEARAGLNVPMETLRKGALESSKQTFEGSLHLSDEMIATLNGPGFKIEATTPEQQSVAQFFPTVWSWNVEAQEDGEQALEATLYALVSVADKAARQRVDSYTQKISVSVREQTWGEWLQAFSHGIDTAKAVAVTLGSIATAALGWFGIFFNNWRKRRLTVPSHRKTKRDLNKRTAGLRFAGPGAQVKTSAHGKAP